MEETARLLIYSFLQFLLGGRIGRHIAYTTSSRVILSERVYKSLTDFWGIIKLWLRGRFIRVPVFSHQPNIKCKCIERPYCSRESSFWNLGSNNLIPRSNCTRFSYALTSGACFVFSSSKSRRLNKVDLHSLHSLTSMSTLVGTDFSEEFSDSVKSVSKKQRTRYKRTILAKTVKPTSMEHAVVGSPQTTRPQVLQWCLRKV